jgi:hypothetical protein
MVNNSAYRKRREFMAITFFIYQTQRFHGAFANAVKKRLKQFAGGGK